MLLHVLLSQQGFLLPLLLVPLIDESSGVLCMVSSRANDRFLKRGQKGNKKYKENSKKERKKKLAKLGVVPGSSQVLAVGFANEPQGLFLH